MSDKEQNQNLCGKAIEDQTSSGLQRLSCSCGRAVVKQPYMSMAEWAWAQEEFKIAHHLIS